MWPPPNFFELPSKEQIIGAKGEIESMKLELADAQRRVADAQRRVEALTQSISHRRAWIAPIRTLPTEILSNIFMSACRDDSKSALILTFVRRKWRNILLDTPRAWAFIPLFHCNGKKNKHSKLASMFIQRGRNSPLHVFVNDYTWLDPIHAQRHRIQCMCLEAGWRRICHFISLEIDFSRLERLRVDKGDWKSDLPDLGFDVGSWDMMHFPNLMLLELSVSQPILLGIAAAPKFPAIRQLTVQCDDPFPLTDILMKSADSLEFVNLTYESSRSNQPGMESKLRLPLLKHLRLADRSTGGSPLWAFKASTPNLEAYFDVGYVSTFNVVEVDTGSVTHLDALSSPPLHIFPRLANLFLVGATKQYANLMETIKFLDSNPHICTDLKVITYTTQLLGCKVSKVV